MKEIPLSKGYVALVDDEDVERVSAVKWSASSHRHRNYAVREQDGRRVYLHRFILLAGHGVTVDHINGDPLDNRRANLRVASQSENCFNRCMNSRNSSGFKGVSFSKKERFWIAQIGFHYRNIRIGRFLTAEEAYEAYCEAAERLHGEFARTK